MQLNNFINRLDKIHQSNNAFEYKLGKLIQVSDIMDTEMRLKIVIPNRIKSFYLIANGLKTINPCFELIELNSWIVDNGLIHFATFDNSNKIYFDIKHLNQANEWTILNKDSNYEITLTISSFWSNKIWHWIEQKKKIWSDNWWIK